MRFTALLDYISKIKSLNLTNESKNIKKNKVLFFIGDTSRSLSLKNKAFSPLADSLQLDLEARGISCQTVALPWSRLLGSKAYGNPVSINNDRFFEVVFKKIKLTKFYKYIYNYRNPYHKIILKAEPKFIISIGCPEDLCKEARLAAVPHAELLHGMGYKPIPWGWGKRRIETLPQIILSLDQTSFQTFSVLKSKKIRTYIIPHPMYKNINNLKLQKIETKTFLVSLTWGYAGDHGDQEMLKGILKNGLFPEKLLNVIKNTENINWKFRLHPVQKVLSKYKDLVKKLNMLLEPYPNCEWEKASGNSFPEVIKDCTGHLTMSSMTCYDAAYFGITSLVFCPTLRSGLYKNMFSDLESKGYVKKIEFSEKYVEKWLLDAKLLNPYRPPKKRVLKDYRQFLSLIRKQ
jgi:hypothetical protein